MSSSERVSDAPRDDTTDGVIYNEKNGDDRLESLEAQFQNKVHVSTTATVDDEGDDDAKIIKTPASATEYSVKVPDEAKYIDVAGDEEVEQFPSHRESVKPIPSNNTNTSLQRIATLIREAKNILVLSGAGVSVAAGIPDFRTPGMGLYDNLQKYNLPYAEAVFDIQYYQVNPHPFIKLASELWPQHHRPTITHTFIALLAEKQRLLRNYTQNIDGLEHLAGVPEQLVIECHGHFRSARCIRCKKASSIESVKECIVSRQEVPVCTYCSSGKSKSSKTPAYVKPDIVFFGEQLPYKFHATLPKDVDQADLCIIMGTSLQVPPTAYIPDMVQCNRVLLNRELVGNFKLSDDDFGEFSDVFHPGDCDDSIMSIARLLGWDEELHKNHAEILNRMKGQVNVKTDERSLYL